MNIEESSQQIEDDDDSSSSSESFWINSDTLGNGAASNANQAHEPSSFFNPDNNHNRNSAVPDVSTLPDFLQYEETGDVPMPTVNGGFSHTKASRAKISAANKGKVPWNKGKQRSEETKARIAAGVRARNRERFLQKLKDMNMTEAEYEQQQIEDRRKKESERQSRRTSKGGYRPTKETRQKISKVLKAKHASGQVKPRKVDPEKVRRGFTHSKETRQKISESLRKRWAEDPNYRAKMVANAAKTNRASRDKISATLKKRWEDVEFRAHMMNKLNANRQGRDGRSEEHRRRISEAIKKKWQDEAYRKKTQAGVAKRHAATAASRPKSTKGSRKSKKAVKQKAAVAALSPLTEPRTVATKKVATKTVKRKKAAAHKKVKKPTATVTVASSPKTAADAKSVSASDTPKPPVETKKKKVLDSNGNMDLLKEKRRDLYDLLYGDEPNVDLDEDDDEPYEDKALRNTLGSTFAMEDDNLDTFDPYGLEDF